MSGASRSLSTFASSTAPKVTHVITYSTIKGQAGHQRCPRVLDYPVYMGQRLSRWSRADPKVKLKQVLDKQPGKGGSVQPRLCRGL